MTLNATVRVPLENEKDVSGLEWDSKQEKNDTQEKKYFNKILHIANKKVNSAKEQSEFDGKEEYQLLKKFDTKIEVEKEIEFPEIQKYSYAGKPLDYEYIILQSWEGWVISKRAEEFTAVIKDLSNTENPNEEVVISIEEISKSDRDLIEAGAVFYWYIGYKDNDNGNRERVSNIRFRRLPGWSKKDFERAEKLTDEWVEHFKGEQNSLSQTG